MWLCRCGLSSVNSDDGGLTADCCREEKGRLERNRLGREIFSVTDDLSRMLVKHYGIHTLYDGEGCGYRLVTKGGWKLLAYRGEKGRRYSDVMDWDRFLDWLPKDAKALVLAHVALYDRYMHANRVL